MSEHDHDELTANHIEEQLRRNHDTFFNLIVNAPFGVYVVDAQFCLRQVSAGAQKVFSNVKPLIGRDFAEALRIVWPEPFASEAIGRFRHTLSTGEPYAAPSTVQQRHDIGEMESYDWKIERVILPDGQFGVVCYFYDITERKRAESALRDSEERLRAFAGQLERRVEERTQELVQSQDRLRALATELNLSEQRERQRLATDLHDYLAQLLVLGKMTLGRAKQTGLPPRAEELVKETEETLGKALSYCRTLMAELSPPVLKEQGLAAGMRWLGEQMKRQDVTVTVEVAEIAPLSLPDDCAVLLFQSVRELLINVAKHAPDKEATVRMTHDTGRLMIVVRDENGFDPAAAASKTSHVSSKFGLFSIRERMKSLGGAFEIVSAPGQGTTATLMLPFRGASIVESSVGNLERPMADTDKGSSIGQPPSDHSSNNDYATFQQDEKIRVLLVDDHTMVRQGLRSVLESYSDVEVVGEAVDGEEAVAFAARLQPSLVVMDINMPKMNGIEATAAITARYPGIVVIGLSVQAGGAHAEAMRKAGAFTLLTKEAAVDEIYRVMRKALGTKPAADGPQPSAFMADSAGSRDCLSSRGGSRILRS